MVRAGVPPIVGPCAGTFEPAAHDRGSPPGLAGGPTPDTVRWNVVRANGLTDNDLALAPVGAWVVTPLDGANVK